MNKAVSYFGSLELWHNPGQVKTRVLVRVLINQFSNVPRSMIFKRANIFGGLGRFWTVPVYILTNWPTNPPNAGTEEQAYEVMVLQQQQAKAAWGADLQPPQQQLQANGWPAWPEVPPQYRGDSWRQITGYTGPSMMDGVEPENIVRDNGMDAWNAHVE